MQGIGPGRTLMALGMAGLGVLSLIYGDFALQWQAVPQGIPWRETLARLSGVTLLALGAGLVWGRSARPAALGLTLFLLTWVLGHLARVAAQPLNVGEWLGVAESSALICGAWIVYASLARREASIPAARLVFGVCCVVFGLSHLVYLAFTASMIPAWMPGRLGLAAFTGAAHMAAGLAIITGVVARLAAVLEAVMMTSFIVLVHLTGVAAEPASRLQWTMVFVALALSGAAWAVAGSMAEAPWGLVRGPRAAPAEAGS